MIRYLNPGERVGHEQWDAFYAEADAKLGKILNNIALAVADPLPADYLYGRIFFFIPRPASTTDWSNLSEWYFVRRQFDRTGVYSFARLYEHSVFTDIVNSLPLATPVPPDVRPPKDDQTKVARLDPGDLSAFNTLWAAKLLPDQPNPFNFPAENALYLSLECHTRTFPDADSKPQKYNLFIDYSIGPEYIHQWTPVDIVIGAVGATFTFPDNYNKYNVFRFHNLQFNAVTVNFGGHHSVTIPALRSKCVRRSYPAGALGDASKASYTDGYQYFQKPLAGDPWFMDWQTAPSLEAPGVPVPGKWSNITDVMCGSFMASHTITSDWQSTLFDRRALDLSKVWDPSAIYNNAGRTGLKHEMEMPAGGWFGPVSEGTILGDLAYHRGKLVVIDPAGDFLVWHTQAMTVDAASEQHIFRKEDGSTALGVTSVSVTRVADGLNIPELSSGDRNWLVASVNDAGGKPIYFYIVFVVRLAGNDPKLAAGDKVQVRFRHKTDDRRHIFAFEGMATLTSKLADVGIVLDQTPSFPAAKDFTLSSEPPRDLISLSSNLILGTFGVPGKTIGNGANGNDAVLFPYFSNLSALVRALGTQAQERTAQYWKWDWDGSGYINIEQLETTPWQNHFRVDVSANEPIRASYFDTVGSLLTQFRAAAAGDASTNVSLIGTIFGPKIVAKQSFNTAYPPNFIDDSWDLDLTGHPAFVRRQFIAISDLSAANPSFGWPQYQGNEFGGFPAGITLGAMKTCFPRVERYWAQKRFFTHKVAEEPFVPHGFTLDTSSSEEPLVKAFYETDPGGLKVPLVEGRLLPVAQSKSNASAGMALLGMFGGGEFDIWPRFSAWLNYGIVTFKAPGGDVIYDFTKGSGWQTAYYNIERGNVLNGTPGFGDGIGPNGVVMVKKELPISIEHYNAAASAVNACGGSKGVNLSDAQLGFFSGLGARINQGGQAGFGLGAYYASTGSLLPRPRAQWIGWDAQQNPGISEFLAKIGCPVRAWPEFPTSGSLNSVLNMNQLFKWWGINGNETTEIVPFSDPPHTQSVLEFGWGEYLWGMRDVKTLQLALDNYRWVSIADAVALHQRMGLPFIFQELSVPMFLHWGDAQWTVRDTRPWFGVGTLFSLSRALNWVNSEGGDWVMNNDANGEVGPRIMAAGGHEQTDYCLYEQSPSDAASVLVDADYPNGMQKRFYEGGGQPVPATQRDIANEFYLYRNYGNARVYSVVFPRNYAGYRKNFNNTFVNYEAPGSPFENRPRNVNNGLEGGDADVKELGAGENVISTTVENGELWIVQGSRDV